MARVSKKAVGRGRRVLLENDLAVWVSGIVQTISVNEAQRVIDSLFAVACAELKKFGKFNFINMVRLVLKPAVPARYGLAPFTKKQSFFKPKPPQVRCFTLRRFKLRLGDELECYLR